jgi:MoxR-like ATPase
VEPVATSVSAADLRVLSRQVYHVDLAPVTERYVEVAHKIRDLGIALSDRRAVKLLKVVAASAVLCGRRVAMVSDLWVLRYVWDREEQIDPLAALINGVLEPHADEPSGHPLAATPGRVDGEELARQLDAVEAELRAGASSLAAIARLRERVTDLSDHAAWLLDDAARGHLRERTARLLERLG